MNLVLRRAGPALVALSMLAASAAVRAQGGDTPAPAAGNAAKVAPAVALKPPAEVDGVLLDDGRQIEGTFKELAGERWVITPKGGGETVTVSMTQIVVAEKGGEIEQHGEDSAAAHVWRAAVRAAYCDALESIVTDYAGQSLVDSARAVIATMKASGADAARLAKLGAALENKTQAADSAMKAALTAREDAAKAALIAGFGKGIAWCTKREFPTAATAMLNDIERLDPTRGADLAARAKALMPASFFFKAAPDAVAQWRKWADTLLPSSAQFVDHSEEDVWNRLENKPWTDGATLCFRTRNVILFIREMDPAICGTALRLAEQTVRALQVFLRDGKPDVVSGDISRLEIRIHKSRADYLAEEPAHGKKADAWSAGFFSPLDAISHFYIDRGRTKNGAADIEELTRVLTHEFTHHYVSARWAPGIIRAQGATQMSGGPGFWIVEGIAEFVQNQSHHLDDRGPQFDDDDVHGNRATAGSRKAKLTSRYLTMEKFIDMSQADFQSLSDDMLGMIPLGRSGGVAGCTERSLWYDQAGALTYFFLQKKGPEIRKKYVNYVADHYAGNKHVPGWAYFGYPSAQALEDDFAAFLKTVGG